MAIQDFDELDRRIIELLCRSSQGSYRQIAKQLGVHPTTLIQRIKALETKGIVNGYRGKIDYMRLGYEFMGIVQIYAEGNILEVQKAVKELDQVVMVVDVTGDCDSIAWVACKDREEFSDAVKAILSIEGVKKTNTSVVLNMLKDPFDFVPNLMQE